FTDPQSLNSGGGRYHLWLAISAGIAACIAGALMFHFFARHQKDKWPKEPKASIGTVLTAISGNPSNNSVTSPPFDAIRWGWLNPWLSEGQADDRLPMNGSVADSGGSASAQRAFARRSHQIMFKKWSQARHD
ncbi:MAG TPA: hypothetical protein VFH31_10220, partial [Pyrinomonadaceae bacterium]|nr:hypothetical protein [Pyrinomonadaceae bacterium]